MMPLPSALESFDEIISRAGRRRLVLFLDYDGTLTPIVAHPEDAVLSREMERTLDEVSREYTLAVVSGRDRADVAQRVGLEHLIYAGSHGFDISGPEGLRREHPQARQLLPRLDEAEALLKEALDDISGSQVDRKRFAIAVHYRNVDPDEVAQVEAIVDEALGQFSEFKKSGGKKVFELKPDVDWHKGRALMWLMEALGLSLDEAMPIYIGDDVTDEDAFAAIADCGVGIVVGPDDMQTLARFRLESPDEVKTWLARVARSGRLRSRYSM